MTYQIFIEFGGKTTKKQYLLDFVCLIFYLILSKSFDSKKSFLNLIPLILLIVMILFLCLYIKLINDKLFKPYVKKLNLKPKNASICYSFATECIRNNIPIDDLKSVERVLTENIDTTFSVSLTIILPILFAVISNLLFLYCLVFMQLYLLLLIINR